MNGNESLTLEKLENTVFLAAFITEKISNFALNLLFCRNLKQFLTNNPMQNPKNKENFLKQHLLKALTYHFEPKISADQHITEIMAQNSGLFCFVIR